MATASAVPVSGPQLDNRRVIAALIDMCVVIAGAVLIFAVAGVGSASEIPASLDLVVVGWALYYYFALESSESAQTLGKRVTNIRVVRLDGSPATMRDIAMRTVLRIIDAQFFYLVGLIVMMATGERRGRLGDLAARTKIVSADDSMATSAVAAPATAEAPAPSRVPIAESGPAFAEPAEPEASEQDTIDMTSPSLKELAADVEATAGSAPDAEAPQPVPDPDEPAEEPADDDLAPAAEVEDAPEPVGEEPEDEPEPIAEVAEESAPEAEHEDEPVAEVADEPVAEAADEPATEAELDPEPVVEIVSEPEADAEAEPIVEVLAEPEAEAEDEPEVEHEDVLAEADALDDEAEDDPLAGGSDDELDEAEIAAAVEAELNGESASKTRRRSSARAKR